MRNKLIYPNDYPYKTLLLINIHIQNQKKKIANQRRNNEHEL